MTIRPVDFNGMIQNTHEVTSQKTSEDNKSALVQQNVQTTVVKQEQQASTTVVKKDNAYGAADGDGDGTGYDARGRNRKNKKRKELSEDGTCRIKNGSSSFDIKI